MSEYFLGGRNDGGALMDESKRVEDKILVRCQLLANVYVVDIHKTASEFNP